MIADLAPMLISLAGRSGTIGARATRRMAGAVITQYSRKHSPKMQVVTTMPCACQSWKKADFIYQGFSEETKAVWRAAVKKAGISAYDLWMKATVWNFARNLNAPDVPPVSGGFSQSGNIPGDTWHPPPLDSKPWYPEEDPDFKPEPPPEPGAPCFGFCDFTYQTLFLKIIGMTDEWAVLNGVHSVGQSADDPCMWSEDVVEKITKDSPTDWAVSVTIPAEMLIANGQGLSESMDCGEGSGNFTSCEDPIEDRCDDFPGWGGSFEISTSP